MVYGLGGAFLGYVLWHLLGSLEDWQYYAIRSAVTGETAMSSIIAHPADRWVVWGLFLGFIFGGTFAGFAIARRRAGH